jgi:solute carrier family 25 (mitochondrial aspartate/glutamate transporter), member 12/13
MATVTESVGKALLGSNEDPNLSQQTRAAFAKYAVKDPETGERFLGENEFIDAIAPASEDYVSASVGGRILSSCFGC